MDIEQLGRAELKMGPRRRLQSSCLVLALLVLLVMTAKATAAAAEAAAEAAATAAAQQVGCMLHMQLLAHEHSAYGALRLWDITLPYSRVENQCNCKQDRQCTHV
jgi:hypothetical protein